MACPSPAIIFGGRRAKTARSSIRRATGKDGVFVGSTMASGNDSRRAAGAVGVVRRDPMAMLPFCGYNMGDYWAHWLEMGKKLGDKARRSSMSTGSAPMTKVISSGRASATICACSTGLSTAARARLTLWKTPIGYEPKPEDIDVEGLDITTDTVRDLLSVDKNLWKEGSQGHQGVLCQIWRQAPQALESELVTLESNLNK